MGRSGRSGVCRKVEEKQSIYGVEHEEIAATRLSGMVVMLEVVERKVGRSCTLETRSIDIETLIIEKPRNALISFGRAGICE